MAIRDRQRVGAGQAAPADQSVGFRRLAEIVAAGDRQRVGADVARSLVEHALAGRQRHLGPPKLQGGGGEVHRRPVFLRRERQRPAVRIERSGRVLGAGLAEVAVVVPGRPGRRFQRQQPPVGALGDVDRFVVAGQPGVEVARRRKVRGHRECRVDMAPGGGRVAGPARRARRQGVRRRVGWLGLQNLRAQRRRLGVAAGVQVLQGETERVGDLHGWRHCRQAGRGDQRPSRSSKVAGLRGPVYQAFRHRRAVARPNVIGAPRPEPGPLPSPPPRSPPWPPHSGCTSRGTWIPRGTCSSTIWR